MKLIESKAELVLQQEGLEGVYKQIEFCGRTCYKSEDKITEDSAKAFVDRMIKSGHTAMLEHGTIYLAIPDTGHENNIGRIIANNKYTKCNYNDYTWYITTNLRVLVENNWLDDLKYICEPTEYHERRYTMKLTTDRGVSHELVRHRVFSFAQESTRYCNYSKDKFGGEITFIKPSWFKENQLPLDCKVAQSSDTNGAVFYERPYKMLVYEDNEEAYGFNWHNEDFFIHSCQTSEQCYFLMLEEGATPQQARQVLPNALKTEVCMTGFASDWQYFFDLRLYGITGAPHPDMKALAELAMQEFDVIGLADKLTRSEEQIATLKAQALETYKKYMGK